MERDTIAKKILFGVLDTLLVIGAIASILTIDRGQWIISNPAFYQPPIPAEARQYAPLSLSPNAPPVTQMIIPQTGGPCPAESQPDSPAIDDQAQSQAVYVDSTGSVSAAEPQGATASTICED